MTIKVKELKDDALVDIKVNKSYYLMVKNTLYNHFSYIKNDDEREELIKGVMTKSYTEMTDWQKSFYTLSLLIAEIERSATEANLVEEKEVTPDLPTQES